MAAALAMAARPQLLQLQPYPKRPPNLSQFCLLSRSSTTAVKSSSALPCVYQNASFTRKISSSPILCSNSDYINEAVQGSSIVGDLLDYLNESWTQFHATAEAKRQLLAAGFHLLNENEEWNLHPGGRYVFTRNMSSLVAFTIGEK